MPNQNNQGPVVVSTPPYGRVRGTPNRNQWKEFFVYSATFTALAAGTTATAQIPVQADSDFVLEKMTYFAHLAGAAQTAATRVIPNWTLQITDTGSNRLLSDFQIFIPAMFGTGEIPFILPQPKVFRANSVIQLNVTSAEAANAYTLQVAFVGHKIFYGGITG